MKATIEYDDEDQLRDALDGWRWRGLVQDLDNWLRGLAKYESKNEVSVEEVRGKLREGAPRDLWD